MYIVRDIFYLKFGHYKDAKALLDEARQKNLVPEAQSIRVLTDFTGEAYRLILEGSHSSLSDYEKSLNSSLNQREWQEWYSQFKQQVDHSQREILKHID